MPRIARAVVVHHPHHITQRGNNRAEVFFDDADRTHYINERIAGDLHSSLNDERLTRNGRCCPIIKC